MRDFEFLASEITVNTGEIVRFVVTNAETPHEMVSGLADLRNTTK